MEIVCQRRKYKDKTKTATKNKFELKTLKNTYFMKGLYAIQWGPIKLVLYQDWVTFWMRCGSISHECTALAFLFGMCCYPWYQAIMLQQLGSFTQKSGKPGSFTHDGRKP